MLKFDTRNFDTEQRERLAWKVRNLEDFQLPQLDYWNYELCRRHRHGWEETYYDKKTDTDKTRIITTRPKPGCRECGIHFRQHQRVGIMWMYLKKRGLLADTMGSGKTTEAGGLIAMMLQTGELSFDTRNGGKGRAIIVPRSPALDQWNKELLRMMPGLNIIIAEGTQAQRRQLYLQPWQVLLIGPEMLRGRTRTGQADYEILERFPLSLLLTDDIDTLRNPDTDASYVLDRMGSKADRYFIMSGTPLQKRLPEIHSVLDGVGGLQVFGSLDNFEKSFVRRDVVSDVDKNGKRVRKSVVVGYKNMTTFKRKLAPMVLRRTAADLHDVSMPTIIPDDVMLDLYPRQRTKYQELRADVLRIMKEDGSEQQKRLTVLSKIHYGAAICAGLAALGEGDEPSTSVKMDWVVDKTSDGGDLGDEKVVIFVNLKNSVRALQQRLTEAGTGFVTIWGDDNKRANRAASVAKFDTDPNCRVLLGTKSIEQSLNLQIARHLINFDMILNPARMRQLAGRIQRDGSAFQHVFVHNLLTINTQEASYLAALEREEALSSYVWDEESPLFQALSSMQLAQMITG